MTSLGDDEERDPDAAGRWRVLPSQSDRQNQSLHVCESDRPTQDVGPGEMHNATNWSLFGAGAERGEEFRGGRGVGQRVED
jgi:hypothetical protein